MGHTTDTRLLWGSCVCSQRNKRRLIVSAKSRITVLSTQTQQAINPQLWRQSAAPALSSVLSLNTYFTAPSLPPLRLLALSPQLTAVNIFTADTQWGHRGGEWRRSAGCPFSTTMSKYREDERKEQLNATYLKSQPHNNLHTFRRTQSNDKLLEMRLTRNILLRIRLPRG